MLFTAKPQLPSMRESSTGTREGSKVKTRSASFGKKVAKEVGKAGRTAALKVRRMRAANLTFEASTPDGGVVSRKFAIVNKLGEGGYSTIWSVRERQPDGAEVEYAVKRVLIDGSDSEQLALVEGEIAAMRSLPPHPHIVTLLGFCRKPRAAGGSGRSGLDEFYLLLEMCAGGSLAGMLQRRHKEGAPLQPAEVLRIFLDMCHAVTHLHTLQRPLAHRDVKPENFVLSGEDGLWKLCDFGSASSEDFQHVEGTRSAAVAAEEERVHRFSTPQYRAPEMCDVRRGEPVGVKVDVWALGVSLYKMLHLQDLFGVAGEEKLAILNFRPDLKLPLPSASEDPLQAMRHQLNPEPDPDPDPDPDPRCSTPTCSHRTSRTSCLRRRRGFTLYTVRRFVRYKGVWRQLSASQLCLFELHPLVARYTRLAAPPSATPP